MGNTDPSGMASDLQRVLQGMQPIESVADLKAYCAAVDELYLSDELVMFDSDWTVFTEAVSVRTALLSDQKN